MSTTTTITDVVGYIATKATTDEVEIIFEAAKSRDRAVREAAAAKVSVGAKVMLNGLSPKYLNGLSGVVTRVTPKSAEVQLNHTSRVMLTIRDVAGRYAVYTGKFAVPLIVPLGCCVVM